MTDAVQAVFDGADIQSKADFFAAFRAIDGVPDWSGDNVDMLWEVVTGRIERPIDLIWVNAEQSRAALGIDFMMIWAVLQEAVQWTAHHADRPRFTLTVPGTPN